jgi:hypothetical protein
VLNNQGTVVVPVPSGCSGGLGTRDDSSPVNKQNDGTMNRWLLAAEDNSGSDTSDGVNDYLDSQRDSPRTDDAKQTDVYIGEVVQRFEAKTGSLLKKLEALGKKCDEKFAKLESVHGSNVGNAVVAVKSELGRRVDELGGKIMHHVASFCSEFDDRLKVLSKKVNAGAGDGEASVSRVADLEKRVEMLEKALQNLGASKGSGFYAVYGESCCSKC